MRMTQSERPEAPTHLQCREIQAPLVAALIEGFAAEFGRGRAQAVTAAIIDRDAARSGRDLAARFGDSLADLHRIVEEVWATDDAMELANVELDDRGLRFDVVRCGYAEMYERLGLADLGCLLSCRRDFAFMDGFNPGLRLVRTKTIMEGGEVCDFRYEPVAGAESENVERR
jgi:hypothetical protein